MRIIKVAIAQKRDRLEQIAFKHYGTLLNFCDVLEINSHLLHKVELDDNDMVNLPEYIIPVAPKRATLW